MIKRFVVFAALSALVACTPSVVQTPAGPTELPPAPTQAAAEPLVCNSGYARHELASPYQQDKNNPDVKFTLAPDEFSSAMRAFKISSVCVPEGADAPYVKFDSKTLPSAAVVGRMVVYSFDRWRQAQIVYSTYDVSMPTEYDTYATAADFEAMQNASAPGFERIMVGLCYGKCTVYKTFVYPFADHYVALTLDLGAYEYGSAVEEQVRNFKAGEYPAELQEDLQRFDTLVRGMEFAE